MSAASAMVSVAPAEAQTVSCTTNTAVATPPDANVVVIGDSLTVGEWCFAKSAVGDYNGRGLIARVDARVGRFTSTGVGLLRSSAATLPDNVVVALGTNDLTSGMSDTEFRQRLESAVGIAGAEREVYVVTVYSSRSVTRSEAYNLAMFDLARSYPNVTVIDWAARLRASPALLASDGVHLTVTGSRARSAFIATAIAEVAFAPSPPATTTAPLGSPVGFTSVTPSRIADSRQNLRLTSLKAGVAQRLQVASTDPIPADATAVAVNITVTETARAGHLTAYPCGPLPEVSSLNWPGPGWTVANSSIAPLDATGGLCLSSIVDTQVIVDVTGWFSESGTDRFNPVTPIRVGDTRSAAVPREGTALRFEVAGAGSIPTAVTAVAVNVVVVDPSGPAHATVYPCGSSLPRTSTVNMVAGTRIQSNNAIVPVGDGAVCVFTSLPADVVVDVTGWFAATGNRLQPIVPIRLLDTRLRDPALSGGMVRRPVPAGQGLTVAVAGVRGVPVESVAASLNVTAVGHLVDGFVAVHPATSPWPGTSSLNTHAGMADSNGSQAALGGGGVSLLPSAQGHLIVDISGVWVPDPSG